MKLDKIIELIKLLDIEENTQTQKIVPFKIGQKYFIRTVTYHLIGEVECILGQFLIFKKGTVSWVADSGRFMQAINDGLLKEVEPVKVIAGVNIDSIVDYYEWAHALPREQK